MSIPSRQQPGRRSLAILGAALLAALCLSATPGEPADATQAALLAGVRAFRGERYEEALAAFRRLQAGGQVPDIGLYLGMTLHKLGRHAEALTAFRLARQAGAQEPVAEYYQAVSCYRLGLLARAHGLFTRLQQGAVLGPRLQQGAGRFLQALDAASGQPSLLARYEAAAARAEGLLASAPAEAIEWLEEAAVLARRLPPSPGQRARLSQALSRVRAAAPELAPLTRDLPPLLEHPLRPFDLNQPGPGQPGQNGQGPP